MQTRKLSEVVFYQEGPGVRKWQFRDEGIKLLNVANIVDGELFLGNTNRFLQINEVNEKYSHFLLRENDIVMASSGVTWGKTATVKKEHLPLCLNTSTIRFRSIDEKILSREYLNWFLKSTKFSRQIERIITGSAQPNFGPSHLSQVIIEYPDINCQYEISEMMDEANRAYQLRKASNEIVDGFLQSSFLSLFGDPLENDKGWELKKLGAVLRTIRYGVGSPPVYSDTGIPFIRATNIKGGRIEKKGMVFISQEEAAKIEKCRVRAGDLIVVRSGINTGDAAVVSDDYDNAYAGYDLILEMNYENSVFYNHLINSEYGRRKVEPLTRRAAQPHINAEQIRNLEFYAPPCELQKQFSVLALEVERLRRKQMENRMELEKLFQSLFQKFFG